MNKRLLFNTIGKILILEAFFLVFPLIVAFIYRESTKNIFSIAITVFILLVIGFLLSLIKIKGLNFNAKDGFAIVVISWFLMSIFAGLPFVFSGFIPSIIDATFEMASGFSTTGASILTDVEVLPHSLTFLRSFTHFIGGMGILVFAFAFLPRTKGAVNVMRAEVPGPTFGKLVSRLGTTAQILYKIYLILTLAFIVILIICGMSPFDAFIHGFGTAGTGGFSNRAASIGYYNSPLIEYVITAGMVIFGINFNLYYLILIGNIKDAIKNKELRVYFSIWLIASAVIAFNMYGKLGNTEATIRNVLFSTASVMTTTGYGTADFANWSMFSQTILLLLMFCGGCAGSTAGGFKISRVIMLFKSAVNSLRKAINPRRVLIVTENNKIVPDEVIKSVLVYFVLYMSIFTIVTLIVLLDCEDFLTAISSVCATLNNIGPGLSKVGPTGSFAFFSPVSKICFTITMLVGRLEIIPVLVLFLPNTWSKR